MTIFISPRQRGRTGTPTSKYSHQFLYFWDEYEAERLASVIPLGQCFLQNEEILGPRPHYGLKKNF